jgi:hypothetical protein
MTDRYAVGDWESVWGCEPFLIHRLVLDLQSRCVIAGQDRYRRRRAPMSLADLAYMQQILDETFDDIWTSPVEYQFELRCDVPAWALKAWTWPREHLEESEHDTDESGDESLQIDEDGCRFSVGPVLLSYKGELE